MFGIILDGFCQTHHALLTVWNFLSPVASSHCFTRFSCCSFFVSTVVEEYMCIFLYYNVLRCSCDGLEEIRSVFFLFSPIIVNLATWTSCCARSQCRRRSSQPPPPRPTTLMPPSRTHYTSPPRPQPQRPSPCPSSRTFPVATMLATRSPHHQ